MLKVIVRGSIRFLRNDSFCLLIMDGRFIFYPKNFTRFSGVYGDYKGLNP